MKHHGYVDWTAQGMKGCYFCGLDPEEMYVTFGGILATVAILFSMIPVEILRSRFKKRLRELTEPSGILSSSHQRLNYAGSYVDNASGPTPYHNYYYQQQQQNDAIQMQQLQEQQLQQQYLLQQQQILHNQQLIEQAQAQSRQQLIAGQTYPNLQ